MIIRIGKKKLRQEAELTQEWCPEQGNTRAQRVELQGTVAAQAEKHRERERECLYVCQSVWIPVSASLLVNFAPVGYLCGRERSADFVYQARWRLPALRSCVLLLSSGHVYESQIIRSELRWVRAHRNWLYRCLDVSGEVSDVTHNSYSASLKSNLTEPQRRRRSLHLGSFVSLWHVLPCLLDTRQRLKKSRQRERDRKNNGDRPGDSVVLDALQFYNCWKNGFMP